MFTYILTLLIILLKIHKVETSVTTASINIKSSSATKSSSQDVFATEEAFIGEKETKSSIESEKAVSTNHNGKESTTRSSTGTKKLVGSETTISTNSGGAKLTVHTSGQSKPSHQSVAPVSTDTNQKNHITQSSTKKTTRTTRSKQERQTSINPDVSDTYDLSSTMHNTGSFPVTDVLLISFVVVTVALLFYDIKVRRKITGHLRSSMFRV
ncbi:hypothetical protein RF11_00891 [Thelohanellus kitauei]|uniref:Uncharacterized protein n=1 Tax=Thelohanellus kitauei TaxID=669202 RepID=A0A0C2N3I0_THEKT|nr:hypothetical protein RF11_00891 [Thelohanellus kitauei]